MSLQDAYSAWQPQAQAITPEQVNQAINRDKKSWDNGCKLEELNTSQEGVYRVRIWPCFSTPGEWWKIVWLYQYSPVSSLKRGFSPRNFDKPDAFQDWLDMQLPYDPEAPQAVQAVRGAGPKWRAICLIQVRGMLNQQQNQWVLADGMDPNTLMVLQMPYKKQGFLTAVSPVISQLAAQGVHPVDIYNGYDAQFSIVGKMRDKTVTNFQFMVHEGPTAAADQATLEKLYNEYYSDLNEVYTVLTDEDMQAYIEYYEPIVELLQQNPHATIDPRKPEARGQAMNMLGKSSALIPGIPGAPPSPPTGQAFTPPAPPTQPPPMPGQPPVAPQQPAPMGQPPQMRPPEAPALTNPTPPAGIIPPNITPAVAGGPPAQPLSNPIQPPMPVVQPMVPQPTQPPQAQPPVVQAPAAPQTPPAVQPPSQAVPPNVPAAPAQPPFQPPTPQQ